MGLDSDLDISIPCSFKDDDTYCRERQLESRKIEVNEWVMRGHAGKKNCEPLIIFEAALFFDEWVMRGHAGFQKTQNA